MNSMPHAQKVKGYKANLLGKPKFETCRWANAKSAAPDGDAVP